MALQQINWTQIDTSNVPSGSIIDLGAVSGALHAVYAENLYADEILVSGQTLTQIISNSGTAELNIYTASLKDALETTGSNLTVKGNLLVKGTTTAVNSTTVAIGDNIIELNGTSAVNGGLLIKDPTNPNTISGSLLWDTTNDYWIAGPLGSEEKIIRQSDYTTLSSSLSASINTLSGSLSGSISQLSSSLSSSINTLSSSLSASINSLSGSVDTRILTLSSSISSSINSLSESVDNRILTLSSSLSSSISNVSSSLTSSIGIISSSLSNRIDQLNTFSSSISGAIEVTGSNVTIKGDLLVKGTTTSINSTTVAIGDNIIELNGSEAAFGGLMVKDVTNPDQISGSLLWDSANNYWIAGQVGDEEKIILQTEFTNLSSSISASINTLSGSLSGSISALSSSISNSLLELRTDLDATNIWQETGSFYATNNNIQITGSVGSLLNSPDGSVSSKYAFQVSESIHAANINVGNPTSNNWQTSLEGSYFNNFNANTDVSEILRFVAGLLSASAPDASPNTKGYNGYTKNSVNTTTGTVTVGSIPQSSTNTTVTYLQGKGFATAGSTIFSGISPIYTQTNFGHTFTSISSGTTIVSSSVDSQLFGLGTLSSGTPTSFKVSGSFTFKFKNNSSKTDTSTSGSQLLITQTGAGTTSGVSLARINTANNAVIPPAYQDGKFASVFSPSLYGASSDVSSSGYYHISSSISIASGSSAFTTPIDSYTEVFYAPLSTISTNVPAQTPTFSGVSVNAISAVSRSLSGAPYLSSATYTISGSILGLFNPLYYAGTGIATITDSDSLVTESGGVLTVSTAGGTIQTANAVYDSTGVTARGTGTVPYETDIVKVYTTSSFAPGTSDENINQTGLGTTSFSLQINGLNKAGSTTTNTSTVSYHTAGNFGQPSASGSLAYYGRPQTGDTATALVESFTGESYRLVVNDNILTFNGTPWTTSFGLYNLGATDLQVKPGYLVKPGGTYGYWLTNPSSASDYKFYIRKFSTTGTKSNMTLNLGQTLQAWDSSTSGVSVAILFESSKSGVYTPPRFYDPSKTTSNFVGNISANTDGQNPFGSTIALYGNTGGSLSSTTYTVPIRNADGMFINATYDEIYVLVRYKGDPTPITGITVTFS
jgi:hypothetical protein